MGAKIETLKPGTVFVTEDDRTGITIANEDLDDEAHFAAFLEPDERLVAEKFPAKTSVRALFPLYPVVDGFDDLVAALRPYVQQHPEITDVTSLMLSDGKDATDVIEAIAELCKLALAQAKK